MSQHVLSPVIIRCAPVTIHSVLCGNACSFPYIYEFCTLCKTFCAVAICSIHSGNMFCSYCCTFCPCCNTLGTLLKYILSLLQYVMYTGKFLLFRLQYVLYTLAIHSDLVAIPSVPSGNTL
jgi:hypothetical protein